MSLLDGNIFQVGAYIEIGIPKEYLNKFKTYQGQINQFNRVLQGLASTLCEFRHQQVLDVETTSVHADNEENWTFINDFNYSISNAVPKSETHTVIRVLDFDMLLLTHLDKKEMAEHVLYSKGDVLNFKIKDIPCSICIVTSSAYQLPYRGTGFVYNC